MTGQATVTRTHANADGTPKAGGWRKTGQLDKIGHGCIVIDSGYVHIGVHTNPDHSTMTTTWEPA